MDEATHYEKFDIQQAPATYQGEDVSDLIQEYWYNIVLLLLLVFGAALVNEFFMLVGFKKGWHRFSELHITDFSLSVFPIPTDINNVKDKIAKHFDKALLAYRVVILLFCIFVWFWTLFVDSGGNFYDFMSFYTIWNFTMLITYFAVRKS